MSRTQIAVTGLGAVSAAGPDVAALARALRAGDRVFTDSRKHDLNFDVSVGEARKEWFALHDHAGLDSPTGRICLAAARECVNDAAKSGGGAPDGLVLGTSTGGQSRNEEVLFALLDRRTSPPFSYRGEGSMAAPTRLVARDLDIRGPLQTVSTACTSSANAIALGASWLAQGRCERVLAGGGDALCHTTIASFHILELTGAEICRPFGEKRPGMTLGEGAGFLMLERLDTVRARGWEPLAVLMGVGMSSDAHHMTAPPEDGAGAELAMRRALRAADLAADDVDHVNAHGTGTRLNDAAEASAVSRLLGSETPVMSVKGLTGHTLGGSGGIEAVVSALSIGRREAFQNLGTSKAAEDCPIALVPPGGLSLPDSPVVLSNSFAFGGNNCTLVFGAAGRTC